MCVFRSFEWNIWILKQWGGKTLLNNRLLLKGITFAKMYDTFRQKSFYIKSGFFSWQIWIFENYLKSWIKSVIILLYIYWELGVISFLHWKLWRGNLTMANGNLTIIFVSNIAAFFQRVKSYFIQFITNKLPETGLIVPWLRFFAFTGRVVV